MAISLADYTPITINSDIFYLITDLDDQLALAVRAGDINLNDEVAGDVVQLYVLRAQTGNLDTNTVGN